MPKKLQLQSANKPAKTNFDIERAKGRPMLQWVGKRPLDKVEYYPAQEKEFYGDKNSRDFNKLFWGDNLQILAHLLKEYRGKIDLIYIDPPFDSKADYVRKVQLKGEKVEGVAQGLLEEKQYTDIWEKDEYLQFMYERLLLMRELLSDTGSIYLHCDWHKGAFLRLIMDEVFGEYNFQNEIIWHYKSFHGQVQSYFPRKHDTVLFYKKSKKTSFTLMRNEDVPIEEMIDYKNWGKYIVNENEIRGDNMPTDVRFKRYLDKWIKQNTRKPTKDDVVYIFRSQSYDDVWDISYLDPKDITERTPYPTQKPEALIERIIKSSTVEGDIVADFFTGSGTAPLVAQKLGRRWIACDINLGAIQTTTKRLNQIISEQQKKQDKNFKGSSTFKIYNVNDYDVFKNEMEAKEIIVEMYGVDPIKRSYFDGVLDNNFVKVMPLNRVLNKMDIRAVLKNVEDKIDNFSVKTKSKSGEAVYEEGVLIIASGVELDVHDFLKKENRTGVKVEIRDIHTDKKNLIFKKKPEAKIDIEVKDKKLLVEIKEFFSPILMRKLELENGKVLKKEHQAKVEDFKQIIDSVAIDVDYNGKLFNAEIMDLPTKKELIKAKYGWEYPKKGKYTVAVKIVDILGEEYFETFEVSA
ncbi:MAG: DNA methyltransferase [bacterium]|nr:DNA methyltransferase [bacterium]